MSGPRAAAALALAAALGGCGGFEGLGETVEPAAADEIALNLVLIGDAGLPAPGGEPLMTALRKELAWDPARSFVVFLGDNVYPHGLPEEGAPDRAEGERILREQMEPLLDAEVEGVFVPGNHDWDAGSVQGWNAIVRQQRWIDERGDGRVRMLPDYGCPGPVVHDVPAAPVRLVFLDTHWWLHGGPKPDASTEYCPHNTPEEVEAALREAVATAEGRHVVVTGHHPMVSGGEHGGYFDWPTYLFPLHPWARITGAFADQDVSGGAYRRLRAMMDRAFAGNEPLLYAAGHDHNLQVLRREPARWLVVSGAGIHGHTTTARAIRGTEYARTASGYMRLTVLGDGRARLGVMVVDAQGNATEDFSAWIAPEPLENPAPRPRPEATDTLNADTTTAPVPPAAP